MYASHRPINAHPIVSGRIPEYLENLKAEYESLAHDVNMYKMQRDDYERKLQAQLSELSNIQQTLYDLERNHTKIKQQYEEEILRLRRQVDIHQAAGSSGRTSPINTFPRPPSPQNAPQPREAPSRPAPIPPSTNEKIGMLGNGSPTFYPTGGLQMDPKRGIPSQQPPPPPSSSFAPKRPREAEFYPNSAGSFPAAPVPEAPHKHAKTVKENILPPPPPQPVEEEKKPEKRPELPKEDTREKKEDSGADWIVGYNPGMQTSLNVDLMHTLDHSSVVCCVKFSNDGKHLATGCNRSAQIYDVETGEKIHLFADESVKEGDLYIRSVVFSPDNRLLAAGAEDKTIKLWDIEQKKVHHTFVGHELDIYSLDWSKDGRLIVSGSGDKKAKIWDVEKGECLFTLGNEEVGPKDGVTSVAFSPDGRLVAAGSLDKIVRLWDAQNGYFLERYEGHLDSVYSVAFSPDGKSLASGSLDKTLKLWDLSGQRTRSRCRSTFSGHKDFVLSVAFSPDGNWLISGSKDRAVQFWDPRSAVTHMMLQGHKNSVISVAVSPLGGMFATGSGDYRARIWKYD